MAEADQRQQGLRKFEERKRQRTESLQHKIEDDVPAHLRQPNTADAQDDAYQQFPRIPMTVPASRDDGQEAAEEVAEEERLD